MPSTPTTTTADYLPLYVFCNQAIVGVRAAAKQNRRAAGGGGGGGGGGGNLVDRGSAKPGLAWPATRFIVRPDSGFCGRRLLQWCERLSVGYVIRLARNARPQTAVEMVEACTADAYAATASNSA